VNLREQIAGLAPAKVAGLLAGLDADQLLAVKHDWSLWARPEQLPPPGDWSTWVMLMGRGAGKTRALAEWVLGQVRAGCKRIALVARTAADCRDVLVEGPAGILACAHPRERPDYLPSVRRLLFPGDAIATTFSAEEPDLLRGPQHDAAACDELAAWARAAETWDMLQLGLRMGVRPRCVVSTTPRPIPLLRSLIAAPSTVVTRGRTWDNAVNLAESALVGYRDRYAGTRLGRQELEGELLTDTPGALWTLDVLDKYRVRAAPELARIVIGVDPAVTSGKESDETGIVAAGKGRDGRYYVLEDATLKASPNAWARRAVAAYDRWQADCLVVESNQGGDLLTALFNTVRPGLPIHLVHAKRGKALRAEEPAALYEQGKVSHVSPPELLEAPLAALEEQMCSWTPSAADSPDRLDACVHALLDLSQSADGQGLLDYYRDLAARLSNRGRKAS
jgi:phage terminase large subunit-like protein